MEKFFQVRTFRNGIKLSTNRSQTFRGCSAVDITVGSWACIYIFFVFLCLNFCYARLWFYTYLLILKRIFFNIYTQVYFLAYLSNFQRTYLNVCAFCLFFFVFLCFTPRFFVFAWTCFLRYFPYIYLKLININEFQGPQKICFGLQNLQNWLALNKYRHFFFMHHFTFNTEKY